MSGPGEAGVRLDLTALAERVYLAADDPETSADDSPYVVVMREDYDALIREIAAAQSDRGYVAGWADAVDSVREWAADVAREDASITIGMLYAYLFAMQPARRNP